MQSQEESTKSQELFQQYCMMGTGRSLAKLAELLGKKPSFLRQLQLYSARHGWHDKALLYDVRQREAKLRKHQDEIERMDEEQATLARALHIKVVKRLNDLMDAGKLSGRELVQLYASSIQAERIARGAATSRLEAKQEIDLDGAITIEANFGTGPLEDIARKYGELD